MMMDQQPFTPPSKAWRAFTRWVDDTNPLSARSLCTMGVLGLLALWLGGNPFNL